LCRLPTCEWPTRPTVGSGVSSNRAAISAGRRSSIYPSGGLGVSRELFYSLPSDATSPHNASTPAFVSSPGCCASPGGPGQPVDRLASSPARGRTTGSDRRVRLVAITGSISRARSGVPWERGGPRLAPPAGAVRLNAKAGLLTLWFDPGNGTVLSVQKPLSDGCVYTEAGGQDPRGRITGSPSWRSATCLAADVVPAGRRGGAGLARLAASTLDCRHRRAGRHRDGWG
jgi:hypothetical protein